MKKLFSKIPEKEKEISAADTLTDSDQVLESKVAQRTSKQSMTWNEIRAVMERISANKA